MKETSWMDDRPWAGKPLQHVNVIPRSTQLGQPSVGRYSEYQQKLGRV